LNLNNRANPVSNFFQDSRIPAEPGQRRRFYYGAAAFFVLSIIACWVGKSYDENMQKWLPESSAFPSTYNKKPSGVSGLSEIVSRSGLKSRLWLLPYRQLPIAHGTLCIFQPLASLKDFEVDQILNWVKSGNHLIYADHFTYGLSRHLLDKLKISTSDGAELKDAEMVQTSDSGVFSHVKSLFLTADSRLSGGTPLVKDRGGNLFTTIPYGKGEIVIGTVPSLCANGRLTEKKQWNNFQFFINLCRTADGEVIFDERCHGFNRATNVLVFLAKNPPGAVFAQLVLMLVLAVAGTFTRFGMTRVIVDNRRLSSLDFVAGLSSVYRRAKANPLALEIIARSYRLRWCNNTAVPTQQTLSELKSRWEESARGNPELLKWCQESAGLLLRIETASDAQRISDDELLNLTGELEAADRNLDNIVLVTNRKGAGK
jgi:hypothetical protein